MAELAKNGIKLRNNLTSGMRLNFLDIRILCFKQRFDLTVALTAQTEVVISVRRRELSNDATLEFRGNFCRATF